MNAETDLDEYLEKLLAIQRKKTNQMTKAFQAQSSEWQAMKEQNKQLDNMVSNKQWLEELSETSKLDPATLPQPEPVAIPEIQIPDEPKVEDFAIYEKENMPLFHKVEDEEPEMTKEEFMAQQRKIREEAEAQRQAEMDKIKQMQEQALQEMQEKMAEAEERNRMHDEFLLSKVNNAKWMTQTKLKADPVLPKLPVTMTQVKTDIT